MAGSSGLRGTTSLLLVVAIAVTGGFLYWVYQQAQSTESSLQPTLQDTASSGQSVTAELLANDPSAAIGRNGMLDSVEVAQSLGRGVFTISANDTVAVPVLLDSELIGRGATVYGGDRVTVGGRFYTLNDSIRSEWVGRGAVDSASAGDIPAVPAFMLADSLDIHS